MKTMTSSFENPIDVVPISTMTSKELVPYGVEYVIPSRSDEEPQSAASSEQVDEEIDVDTIPSTPIASSPMPQFTPVMNDDFWESQHPNSPLFTPIQQIPQSPAPTVQLGSEETHPTSSVHEEIPAASVEETVVAEPLNTQIATEEEPEIPQPKEPEIVIP